MNRLIGLDLMRGIAAYMVFVAHCGPALGAMLGAPVLFVTNFLALAGVELFFALSGFLIGGILLSLQPTLLNMRIFVARRWLRTLPVYYVALLAYLAFPALFEEREPEQPWRFFVFLQNVTNDPKFFGVSWSLAIEEWFYLLLPLLLLLRLRYLHAVLLVIAAGLLLRMTQPVDPRASVLGRLDAIAYGCLMAWLMRSHWLPVLQARAHLLVFAAVAGMATIYAVIMLQRMQISQAQAAILFALMPFFATLAIPFFAGLKIRSPAVIAIATFTASISYPLYVWHREIINALGWTPLHAGTGAAHIAAALVAATAVAYLTHVLVERPFMRMRPDLQRSTS
jgi:peptidoglycan/LPS O-acetylase OafA/YrhL